jgi:putative NADH-flavin reductase
MNTIALFGGSGQTGLQFLKLALEKGLKIKALVRKPETLTVKHSNLEIIKGDVLNQASHTVLTARILTFK